MLKDYAELVNVYHELSSVRVAVLKDLGRVRVEGGWETFNRGDEASIPLWAFRELRRHGYVDIREQPLADSDIGKYLMNEKSLKGNKFTPLRERFYLEVKELLRALKESPTRTSEEALRKIRVESNLSDLIRIRLRKIVQIAFLGANLEDYMGLLLPEERVLLLLLKEIIAEWNIEVLGE